MHLGVTRWSLFVVFSLHNPIIRRWRRKWSKSLINLLSCLEVLIRKLNTSTIWIFSASYFWTSLSDLLSIFVADAIIYDCFILLINSAVCLWWMTLTRLAHTVLSRLCASVISSDEIASSRRGISARLSAWYGHQVLLSLSLVVRLLNFLLHKAIRKADSGFSVGIWPWPGMPEKAPGSPTCFTFIEPATCRMPLLIIALFAMIASLSLSFIKFLLGC